MPSRLGPALRIASRALLALLLLLSALLFLCEKGVLPWPQRIFPLGKIRPSQGLGFTAKLPKPWPGFLFAQVTGVLTENDRVLTPVRANGDVREKGLGTFRVGSDRVLFSTSDGTDAVGNGRAYTLRIATVVAPRFRPAILCAGGLAALLLFHRGLLALLARVRRASIHLTEKPAALSGRTWAFILFFSALALRLSFLWLNPEYTDQQMSIRGTPFSDARDWLDMAKCAATGRGVDASYPGMRALYPLFLANFFTWTGDSVPLAKALQALIGALSAALVFLLLRRAMPLWSALAGAAFVAADPRQITQAGKLMTEPLGLLLTLLSAWCLMLGGERRRPAILFAAGAFFACSNLARPLTLFAFPFFLALIAARAWSPWRTVVWHTAAFTLGTFVCLAPWMLRERVAHGIWAISCNSSSALFAASTPEFGVWEGAVETLPAAAGISRKVKDRYEYFQNRFRENLRAHPGFYTANVVRSFATASLGGATFPPAIRSVALALAIFGATFTLWWRWFPGTVLLISYFGGVLGSALFGNPDLQRVRLLIDWIEIGWTLAGLAAALGLVLRIPHRTDRTAADTPPPRWLVITGYLGAAFLLISTARLVLLNAISPPPPQPRHRFSDEQRASYLAELATRFPAWQRLADPALLAAPHGWQRRVFVEFGTIEKSVYRFPPHVGFTHWYGRFEPRPYLHTSFVLRVPGTTFAGTVWTEFAGEIPPPMRNRMCLIIGLAKVRPTLVDYLENAVESAALIPAPNFQPDFSRALTAPVTPEAEMLLTAPGAQRP